MAQVRKIITIDTVTCKKPEDGFGVDNKGNLFLAISLNNFTFNSVIFTFKKNRIFIKYGLVLLKDSYNVDYFKSIEKNNYNILVLNRVFDLYCYVINKNIDRTELMNNVHAITIIQVILVNVYSRLGKRFGMEIMNIKKTNFSFLLYNLKKTNIIL